MSLLRLTCRAAFLAALPLALAAAPATAASRSALIELFGAPECAACAEARAAAAAIAAENPGRVTWTEYVVQTASPLGGAGSDSRALQYGSPSLPALFVDGMAVVPTGAGLESDLRDAVAAALAVAAPLELAAQLFFAPESHLGSVIVDVTATEDIAEPTHAEVRVVIVEDPADWCCGPAGETSWPRVSRLPMNPLPLGVELAGDRFSQQVYFDLDPEWNEDRLAGLVFVQRASDRSVLQAAEGKDAGTLPPLPIVPDDPDRVTLFPCRPNPAPGLTRIPFYLPEGDYAQLRILDVRGALVRELTAGQRAEGQHLLLWDGTDSQGRRRAPGMYLAVLETSTVRTTQRVVLLR